MACKIVYSSDPKYLAASDILIGDMSDIIYEFLVFNRPIILLANDWVRKELPDIGIKCNLNNLLEAIHQSIQNPNEYETNRKIWLDKTHHKPDGKSAIRVLNKIIEFSKLDNPRLIFIDGNSEVLKNTVKPIYQEAINQGYNCGFIERFQKNIHLPENIYISSHNKFLDFSCGIKIHVDHGNKGVFGSLDHKINQWKKNNYWSNTDLFITEGEISYNKTKKCLGPYPEKTVMVGFPRSDDYLRLNTFENKVSVCGELGLDHKLPLVIYAPAVKNSYGKKRGATVSRTVVKKFKKISKSKDFNILIKLKNPRFWFLQRVHNKVLSYIRK